MTEPQPILISCNRCEREQRILATPERAAGGYPCRCGGRLYPPPALRPCEACGRDVAGRFHVQLRVGTEKGGATGPIFYLCGYRCAQEYLERTLRRMEEREADEAMDEALRLAEAAPDREEQEAQEQREAWAVDDALTGRDELVAQIGRLRRHRRELRERDSDLPADQAELLGRLEAELRSIDSPPALRGTEPEHLWSEAREHEGCNNCGRPWEEHDEATHECPPRPCSNCEGRGEIELPSGQAAPCPYCRPAAAREWSQRQPMPLIGYDPAEDADSELVPNPPEEAPGSEDDSQLRPEGS